MGVPSFGLEFGWLIALMSNFIGVASGLSADQGWGCIFLHTLYLSSFSRPCEHHIHIKTGKGHFSLDQIVVPSSCPLQAMEGTRITQG